MTQHERSNGNATHVDERPVAYVSVDVDPVDVHLVGYGIRRPPCDKVYEAAMPRILEMLGRVGIRATFFVIARDAGRSVWREAAALGHEIASHSMTHPLPFAGLPASAMHQELLESRRRLEDAVGVPVVGFRAPGWDVDAAAIEAIAATGYRYDASLMPSPAYLAGSVLRWALSRAAGPTTAVMPAVLRAFARRTPHKIGRERALCEFPVAVSTLLRLPFTHTLWYLVPASVCRSTYRTIQRRRETLSYQFHAVDLLAVAEDGLDERIGRHPGMRWPLARKVDLLESMLRDIAGRYRVRTFSETVDGVGRN